MDSVGIHARLKSLVADDIGDLVPIELKTGPRDPYVKVKSDRWHDVAKHLRDDAELRFDFLQCITAVDWPKKNIIEVVYHLWSYPLKHSFVVKAEVPRDNPVLPSVADLWGAADWNEREQFDLFGVGFSGHPDLRRILNPDDWPGWPMRKDYKEATAYRGMPTTRPSPLNLLVVYDKASPEAKNPKPPSAAASDEAQESSDE